jgi:predicted RNase H-like HicB family nuclease
MGEQSDYPHYSMIIEWSDEDQLYIVTVPELPGCRTHGATYEEAAQQGRDAMESWVDAAREDEDHLPTPRDFAVRARLEALEVGITDDELVQAPA